MSDFIINIPKPCEADWDQMVPQDNGRFCGICQKTVVDFRAFSENELWEYFNRYESRQICGLFRNCHLDKPLLPSKNKAISKHVTMLLVAGAGLMASCDTSTKGKVVKNDSATVENHLQQLGQDTTLSQQDGSYTQEGDTHKAAITKGKPMIPH